MSLVGTDLSWYYPKDTTDTNAHGGRLSNVSIPNGSVRSLFRDIEMADLTAGTVRRRKFYYKNLNGDNIRLQGTRIYLGFWPNSSVRHHIFAGTQIDTKADLSSIRRYSVANVTQAITAGDTTVSITTHGSSFAAFQAGDTVAVLDLESPADGSGKREFRTITNVSYTGAVATLTLNSALDSSYETARTVSGNTVYTRVASCILPGDLIASIGTITKSSVLGSYDNVNYPITASNVGCVKETFTLTFTSSTAFTIVGDTLGNVGSGNTMGDVTINNITLGDVMLGIPSGFWTGTWATNDSLIIPTTPAAAPIWGEIDVLPGTTPVALGKFSVWIDGYAGSV